MVKFKASVEDNHCDAYGIHSEPNHIPLDRFKLLFCHMFHFVSFEGPKPRSLSQQQSLCL